jgi:hypothetical protein
MVFPGKCHDRLAAGGEHLCDLAINRDAGCVGRHHCLANKKNGDRFILQARKGATARVAGLDGKLRLFQDSPICPIGNEQHNEQQDNGCHDGGIQYSQGMAFLK